MCFASTHDNNICLPTVMFDLTSSSVPMTRAFTVEAWLDNIIPPTPLPKIKTKTNTHIPPVTSHVLKPTPTVSDIPSQSQHHGKRKRGFEFEQPKIPELNQQQYSEPAHRPNKQARIEPSSQHTRSSLRKATVKAISRTPVYAQVWRENFSVSRP